MGELRAYALDLADLRALLAGGLDARDRVAALVRPTLARPPAPAPIGPIFTRVPGTRAVRDDDPAPPDLDRLLAGEPVPADRVAAAWRLVEALVAALSTTSAGAPSGPPVGLGPPPLPLPPLDDAVAGTWTPGQAQALPSLRGVIDAVGSDTTAVVVFWSARADRGPAG